MAGRDHLAQGLETRRPVILLLAYPDPAADLQRLVAQAVAVLEQQQRLATQIFHLHALAVGERMRGGHGEYEGLCVQWRSLEAVHRHGQREHTDVDLARAQALEQWFGLVFVQHEFEPRQLASQPADDVRQQVRADGGNQGQLERPGQRIPVGLRQFDDRIGFLQQQSRPLHDLHAGRGQGDAPGLALDQRHAQVLLELADLCREGRLADEATLRRLAEVALVGQCHEVAEVTQVHAEIIAAAYRPVQSNQAG